MTRLFFAIPLPYHFLISVKNWQADFKQKNNPHIADIRFIPLENLHITALFLGDVENDKIELLVDKVKDRLGQVVSFRLKYANLSLAPSNKAPKMIWASFEQNNNFDKLSADLSSLSGRCMDKKYSQARRQKLIHITLARFKKTVYNLKLGDLNLKDKEIGVNQVNLMESELDRAGAKYRQFSQFELVE